MSILRAQRTRQDVVIMKYVFCIETREVVDSVKGNDAYIKQINYILLFSLVYFEINHISDTLRTRSICTEKI